VRKIQFLTKSWYDAGAGVGVSELDVGFSDSVGCTSSGDIGVAIAPNSIVL